MTSADHVVYLGHATNLIQIGGMRLLTDPIFGGILGVGRRYKPFPMRPDDFGRLDGILLSHAHYDHLDTASLRRLSRDIPVIVPPHTAPFVTRLGYRDVRELAWWGQSSIGAATITATPAAHWPTARATLRARSLATSATRIIPRIGSASQRRLFGVGGGGGDASGIMACVGLRRSC